ncbi:glycosyltransferase family 4 protein [Halococcus agarilyticus]|uniref:glycosyltransferase family 4 protein n=1 Tax=Halococcus agarilyticus TaxID=1232219 RepID=UPI000677F1DB|nr:glycosyltransferase family 4 protein [Halococcus agarilyticus]
MHICMLLPERFPPDVRVEKEAATLRAAGHEITLLCRGGPAEPTFERIDGIDVQRLPVDELFTGPRGLVDGARYVATAVHPVWRRELEKLADEDLPGGSIDAIHVHDLPLVKTALAVGENHDVPVIADLHENYPEAVRQIHRMRGWREIARDPEDLIQRIFLSPTRLKRLERHAVRNAERTITVCEEARAHYLRDCGAAPERVTIVSNTVDLDAFDPDATDSPTDLDFDPDDSFVISYVGNFTEHRGLDTLIEGVAQLAKTRSDAQLVLVGKGNEGYVTGLERLARSLGVRDRLTLTGWVDFDDVPGYIAASDVCAVPHAATAHTETTVPHKLFQYMAMGVPVLATDVAPLARIVSRTGCGRVAPAGDGAAIGRALNELADPDRARECGENGRRAVEHRYSWAHDGARLRAIYDEL